MRERGSWGLLAGTAFSLNYPVAPGSIVLSGLKFFACL
jgi:hypothetical protein